jgi:hypothetical protein
MRARHFNIMLFAIEADEPVGPLVRGTGQSHLIDGHTVNELRKAPAPPRRGFFLALLRFRRASMPCALVLGWASIKPFAPKDDTARGSVA